MSTGPISGAGGKQPPKSIQQTGETQQAQQTKQTQKTDKQPPVSRTTGQPIIAGSTGAETPKISTPEQKATYEAQASALASASAASKETVMIDGANLKALIGLAEKAGIKLTSEDAGKIASFLSKFSSEQVSQALNDALSGKLSNVFTKDGKSFTDSFKAALQKDPAAPTTAYLENPGLFEKKPPDNSTFSIFALMLLLSKLQSQDVSNMLKGADQMQLQISTTFKEKASQTMEKAVKNAAFQIAGAIISGSFAVGGLGMGATKSGALRGEMINKLGQSIGQATQATGGLVTAGLEKQLILTEEELSTKNFNQQRMQTIQRSAQQNGDALQNMGQGIMQSATEAAKSINRNI